jgi:two-component system NtrC family response regulator
MAQPPPPQETRPRILVVDDELSICRSCEKILVREGCSATSVQSGKQALALLAAEPFDVVFTDLKMVEMSGMELLENLRDRFPDVVPVVITGYATIASVVETMKLGAFDYLPKPFTPGEMAAVLAKALHRRRARLEERRLAQGHEPEAFAGIVGSSPRMGEVFQLIRKVAPTSSTVLIIGETGTGKELVARAVHDLSPRQKARFAAVDCGTLSVNLLESELFGHVKGAFTGAIANKPGLFEVASGGTVFLDEICNVGLEVQGKLLRFIQEREFLPVGGTETRRVDVRLIFATNRDLGRMVAEGTFREDLYYRLHVFPIALPPLRERREDIPALAYHLLRRVSKRSGKTVERISEEVLRLLAAGDWPGNVRQLEGIVEWAVISCDGDVLETRHLPRAFLGPGTPEDSPVPLTNREFLERKHRIREEAVAELEREFLLAALQRAGGNVTRAAADVGIKRPNFQAMMRKHAIHAGQEE